MNIYNFETLNKVNYTDVLFDIYNFVKCSWGNSPSKEQVVLYDRNKDKMFVFFLAPLNFNSIKAVLKLCCCCLISAVASWINGMSSGFNPESLQLILKFKYTDFLSKISKNLI